MALAFEAACDPRTACYMLAGRRGALYTWSGRAGGR